MGFEPIQENLLFYSLFKNPVFMRVYAFLKNKFFSSKSGFLLKKWSLFKKYDTKYDTKVKL